MNNLSKITMHPAVSRAMTTNGGSSPALNCLIRLRIARGNVKRAMANQREEIASGAARSWDSGAICAIPAMPGKRLLVEALAHGGLPEDLTALITAEVAK